MYGVLEVSKLFTDCKDRSWRSLILIFAPDVARHLAPYIINISYQIIYEHTGLVNEQKCTVTFSYYTSQ